MNGADNLSLTATLANTGDETLRLLHDPNTVLTPQWKTATFIPTNANTGSRPTFQGAKVKWSASLAVAAKQYTEIAPGQTVSFTHDRM